MKRILAYIEQANREINSCDRQYEIALTLWGLAVRHGDGITEGDLRIQMHALLDQVFDLRARSLQLLMTTT